jgi:MFS family permease
VPPREPLLTARYFTMCGFTFTLFLSAFQIFPTAPYRILDLGGDRFAAGLFLGFQTWASAASAPFTGALGDRIGRRKMLVGCSLVAAFFSVLYAVVPTWPLLVSCVLVYGVFWSGLLSGSSAYMTSIIPPTRRAEGIGYWGMAAMLAVAAAPALGLFLYRTGWTAVCVSSAVLNLAMAGIALSLEEIRHEPPPGAGRRRLAELVEWRVLALSGGLFLCSFGYGGIVSFTALWTDRNGIAPRGIFFTTFALVLLVTRAFSGRLADRVGPRRLLIPCFVLTAVSLLLVSVATTLGLLVLSAVLYAVSYGNIYSFFLAHLLPHVAPGRRGGALGSLLAALDTGIGTGSMALGFLADRAGYPAAFRVAAGLAALSLPVFLLAERRFLPREAGPH